MAFPVDKQINGMTKITVSVYMCLSMAQAEVDLNEFVLWKVVHSTKNLTI